ncbi:acetyltransferase [Candidatus Nomurabacteria bacterium RIFCSPHIGHO2_01_FULL_42_15]|uniref:Acetyltransferase n=1 Tax=Candidatus Nomurabacteria bacterium RIFCSPHIGHO2_01_FULL_42_15 TaxID=1801742 RepID=A0A1F6VEB6_9BACT|nr:MAG: acetyltransferase [Candidatus Nomurabacteria bacterium RIFCSPHIGHO2_01_FULL_42_15]OGI93354.1 MAG: acetyltransferase [Candidatus Nomurabacteria bacterium RIFCSPLOWO2_01_FULL_41_18]
MEDRFKNWSRPDIKEGELTKWHWKVIGVDGFKLGDKTDIGAFTLINAKYGVVIEDEVQIGAHCAIYSESTIDDKRGKVTLKKNCKIGAHSVILPGVTVGENAVVGAMSLVKSDIPPNVVAFGVPAKIK